MSFEDQFAAFSQHLSLALQDDDSSNVEKIALFLKSSESSEILSEFGWDLAGQLVDGIFHAQPNIRLVFSQTISTTFDCA
jgi:hypothetical protein